MLTRRIGRSKSGMEERRLARREFLQGSSALGTTLLLSGGLATNSAAATSDVSVHRAPAPSTPPLLQADLRDSLDAKCRAKRVLAYRVIDDMERDAGWTASPVVKRPLRGILSGPTDLSWPIMSTVWTMALRRYSGRTARSAHHGKAKCLARRQSPQPPPCAGDHQSPSAKPTRQPSLRCRRSVPAGFSRTKSTSS